MTGVDRWLEEMTLLFLEDFLDHIEKDVAAEWEEIERRKTAGEFVNYADYEDATNYPLVRLELGAKTVLYELNALVEYRLHSLAEPIWRESSRFAGLKSIAEAATAGPESLARLKMASDISIRKTIRLIEEHYGVRLSEIEGWEAFDDVRETVNNFKHRLGYRHISKIDWCGKDWSQNLRCDATIEKAREALAQIRGFLKGLWRMLPARPSSPP